MDQDQTVSIGPAQGPTDDEVSAFLDALGVGRESNLIGLLQQVQDRFGYLPAGALEQIGIAVHTPLSRIYGVVSFYAQFYLSPHGRHTIRVCRGTACHVKGSSRVIDTILRKLGIADGQTTPDMRFYLETVACVGTCFLAPVMMIDSEYFGKLTPQRIESVLDNYKAQE